MQVVWQGAWVSLRSEGPGMEAGHAAMLAMAAGLVAWHHSEASNAAAELLPVQGGHARCKTLRSPFPLIICAALMIDCQLFG